MPDVFHVVGKKKQTLGSKPAEGSEQKQQLLLLLPVTLSLDFHQTDNTEQVCDLCFKMQSIFSICVPLMTCFQLALFNFYFTKLQPNIKAVQLRGCQVTSPSFCIGTVRSPAHHFCTETQSSSDFAYSLASRTSRSSKTRRKQWQSKLIFSIQKRVGSSQKTRAYSEDFKANINSKR